MTAETIDLIKRMARNNRLWGAKRIRGELLKLGIGASKRSIHSRRRARENPRGVRVAHVVRAVADPPHSIE